MSSCRDCVARLFGTCHGDYCHAERVSLAEQAERLAAERGHTLSDFAQVKNHPRWIAHCVHCGREIAFTLDPDPGGLAIYGDLLQGPCEGETQTAEGQALVHPSNPPA